MQQVLNKIAERGPTLGILEKLMCGSNPALPFGESAINWSVQGIETDASVKSHTDGSAIATNARAASFDVALKAPDYKHKRSLSPDQIYARVVASAGMTEGDAIAKILERDVNYLHRDMQITIEKQVSILMRDGDVEYVDDQNTTHNYPCYTGNSPIAHTQTQTIAVTASGSTTYHALEAIDELVVACQSKGFQPDALVLGTDAVNQLLADKDFMELIDRNQNKPALIELTAKDGGAFIGRVNTPHGATIEVYSCNEADGGSPIVGAKQGVMLQTGCCTCAYGINAFGKDSDGFELKSERIALCKRREGIDQMLYMASRAVVLPNEMAWQVSTIAE